MNCFMAVVFTLLLMVWSVSSGDAERRQLAKLHKNMYHIESHMLGNSHFVPNITVFGSILMTDAGEPVKETAANETNFAALRCLHARDMYSKLPFPVVEWPALFTKPCPQKRHGHKSERGLAFAHLQIWLDFIYFDPDVLLAVAKSEVKENEPYVSTSYSSSSGLYVAHKNGSLYKNGVPYLEDDIMVIFEDDADFGIPAVDMNSTLLEELSAMSSDLLYLGWCEGRMARPVPLCTHAYAVTRRGARKLVRHFEPCGLALDEAFVVMCKNKWITYRPANPWSYKNKVVSSTGPSHVKTFGIFIQKKLGSFIGH